MERNVNNANTKKEVIKDGTKEFLTSNQHDSKIEVTNPHTIFASNNQHLKCIGQVALGHEKIYANCLQDIGSTGTFITHKCAQKLNM